MSAWDVLGAVVVTLALVILWGVLLVVFWVGLVEFASWRRRRRLSPGGIVRGEPGLSFIGKGGPEKVLPLSPGFDFDHVLPRPVRRLTPLDVREVQRRFREEVRRGRLHALPEREYFEWRDELSPTLRTDAVYRAMELLADRIAARDGRESMRREGAAQLQAGRLHVSILADRTFKALGLDPSMEHQFARGNN